MENCGQPTLWLVHRRCVLAWEIYTTFSDFVVVCLFIHVYVVVHLAVVPPNKGHFGGNKNLADLFLVERSSSLGGSKCFVGISWDCKSCPL